MNKNQKSNDDAMELLGMRLRAERAAKEAAQPKPPKARISEFSTRRFEWTHGRKPRTQHGQRACWYFELIGGKDRQIVQTYGTFTEAKAHLKRLLRENVHGMYSGTYTAEVMP